MRIQVSLKAKTILALLLSVAVMDAFSLFLFARIDTIVNGDLYKYGLQFNLAWAEQYWTYSHLFIGSLTIAIILTGISIGLFSFYVRRHSNASRVACYVLLSMGTALTVFSFCLFYGIDYIVHTDLYSYGLQFSYNWAENYWTYARLMLALIGFGSVITIASVTLISLGARKHVRIDPANLTGSILITTGAIAIFTSVIYSWSILAFIGLGLLFWGITFTYVRTEEYARKILLDTTASSQQATLNQIISELQYEGDVIYLPPKYFSDPETNKAYIPEQKNTPLPRPEQIQRQEQDFVIEKPPGVLFTPPGAELSKLFERTLETSFAKVDLQYLQQNLPKLFIEDLEIAQNLEMETEANKIRIQIENSVYKAPNTETEQAASIYSRLGSPLSSAIACAVAKATGKPIIMEREQNSNDGRDVTIEYRILDEKAQAES
jgi:hypothetical protein